MALEDSYILSSLLGRLVSQAGDGKQPSTPAISAALYAYDHVRRPRSQRLVETSRQAGIVYEFQGPSEGDDPDKISLNLNRRYKWIWVKDLKEDLGEAFRTMDDLQKEGQSGKGRAQL